jgi:hypothetical protein
MSLFAFDINQDWTSLEITLGLLIMAPFLVVYAVILGIFLIERYRRIRERDATPEFPDQVEPTP